MEETRFINVSRRLIQRIRLRNDMVGRIVLETCNSSKLIRLRHHSVQNVVSHRNDAAVGVENARQISVGVPRICGYKASAVLKDLLGIPHLWNTAALGNAKATSKTMIAFSRNFARFAAET